MTGSWEIKVNTSGMPQKVATAFGKLNDMVGAEYNFLAYLGSQLVNGTNHAVLAEQTVITGKDTKNVVVVIFNEKPNDMGATLVNIERVVESGGPLGGINVDVKTDIPDDAMDALNAVVHNFVGSSIKPIALLGTQVTKGTNYIFAATVAPVTPNPENHVALVIANSMTGELSFVDLLTTKHEVMSLGYAFTWLKSQNTSLGK